MIRRFAGLFCGVCVPFSLLCRCQDGVIIEGCNWGLHGHGVQLKLYVLLNFVVWMGWFDQLTRGCVVPHRDVARSMARFLHVYLRTIPLMDTMHRCSYYSSAVSFFPCTDRKSSSLTRVSHVLLLTHKQTAACHFKKSQTQGYRYPRITILTYKF